MNRPKVGLGTIIAHGDLILLHRRKGGHQPGRWCSPGGHLEYGESFVDCAIREIIEECGPNIQTTTPVLWDVVNTIYPEEDKHYVTIFMFARYLGGEPKVMEPEKCEEWRWWDWNDLPTPLMMGNKLMRDKHKRLREL